MPNRLVALDEGPDIPLDRAMVVVGRHPHCDARLDSIRVSRRHCCMTEDRGEVEVRDLGSTNGIRINGQRVEAGRLRVGDELTIAHYRYRLVDGNGHQVTLADPSAGQRDDGHHRPYKVVGLDPQGVPGAIPAPAPAEASAGDQGRIAAAVRDLLPPGLADRCRIQVIVQLPPEDTPEADASSDAGAVETHEPCRPDSSR